MNLRDMSDAAAWMASQSRWVIEDVHSVPIEILENYWQLSRTRLKLWNEDLKQDTDHESLATLVEEILVSEMATRVWTTLVVAQDRRQTYHQSEPIARCAYLWQLEARRQVLTLLTREHAFPLGTLQRIDRLRRRVERWTDVLLGTYFAGRKILDFTFCGPRAMEFCDDASPAWELQQNTLIPLSLRASIPATVIPEPRATTQSELFQTMRSAFPQHAFKNWRSMPVS